MKLTTNFDGTFLIAEKGLKQAETVTNALYHGNVDGLAELNPEEVQQTLSGATLVDILAEPEMTMLKLAMQAKCFPTECEYFDSKLIRIFNKNLLPLADATRIISAGGFYVNQKRCQNISEVITNGVHVLKNGITILRVGKRNFYVVRWLK